MNAVTVERGGGRSVVTRLLARSPLRLLTPRNAGLGAWVFTSSFGGGMVDGDRVELEVEVGAGATAMVGSQAQTKVYRGESSQRVTATVGADGLLVSLPDAVVPYAGARWSQITDVTLDGGSLVLVESFTAGRAASGERWAFARFAARVRVRSPELVVDDGLLLDPAHGPLAARLAGAGAFATVLALGPRAAAVADTLRAAGPRDGEALVAASDVPGGAIARVVAPGSEAVGSAVRRLTAAVAALLGDDPAARKW